MSIFLLTSTVILDTPSLGQWKEGLTIFFQTVFGFLTLFFRLIPWWMWLILIVFFIARVSINRNVWGGKYLWIPPYLKRKRRKVDRMYIYDDDEEDDETYVDKKGYERFSGDDTLVHREVAADDLGRDLESGEVVHHIDGDKLNNDPDNLEVLPNQDEHDRIHAYTDDDDDYFDDDDDDDDEF